MKVLVVADVYPPEVSSAATLMRELAEGLTKRGHTVTVATSYPRYYQDEAAKGTVFPEVGTERGVHVIRVKTLPLHKTAFVIRGIAQLLLPFQFFKKIRRHIGERPDAVIIYTPPLTLGLVGRLVKKRYGARFLLNIQDIFPQNAIDLGILKPKPLIWFFEAVERMVYRTADVITFHSEGGKRFLVEQKGVPEGKIFTLYNWVDLAPYQNLPKPLSYRNEYGLAGKFVLLFAGIFGPAQGLEFVVEVAKRVSDIPDLVFLLVGDGMEKTRVDAKISEYGLGNVVVKPFVSGDDYPYLVRDADAGIVCLSIKNKTPFVPGKFLGYLAAGKPVIAFLNRESDGFELVKKAQCGYAAVSDDADAAAALVRKAYAERAALPRLGENGLAYAKENIALEKCLEKFEKLLVK
jgi:glycosyltransferase involved in cell wall biosynthesis